MHVRALALHRPAAKTTATCRNKCTPTEPPQQFEGQCDLDPKVVVTDEGNPLRVLGEMREKDQGRPLETMHDDDILAVIIA